MKGEKAAAARFLCYVGIIAFLLTLPGKGMDPVQAESTDRVGLGVDVDFYTGPVSPNVWQRMKQAGRKFAIAQAWGGRSRNEFAFSQLSGARSVGGMQTAAYVLLNYDDRVCPTYARPLRDRDGKCAGEPVKQEKPGARWQVQQGLAALGAELTEAAFIAIDVEWFLAAPPPVQEEARARHRRSILDAIDEVKRWRKRPVIYTRNASRHWRDITGCEPVSSKPGCAALYKVINDASNPIPLWDVEAGTPDLGNFQPHGGWAERVGRQYQLDRNMFGLPERRTVDLNVFDLSLFSSESSQADSDEEH